MLSFAAPVAMMQAPNDASRWFVVEQGGTVKVFNNDPNVAATSTFIDISSRVAFRGEAGLLGMAFHPQFPAVPRVYLFYSHDGASGLESQLSAFTLAMGGASLDPGSEDMLITIPKPGNPPEENHNGGNLAFGPDTFLYAGIGDGGGGNDQHGTIGNAQSTNTLLGKMLRIDVNGITVTTRYRIPPSNPFAASGTPCNSNGTSGSATSCAEILAIGMRNPWRWSFDRATGQLWVADVGQGAIEEVDRVDLGGNYGWRCFEGTHSTGLGCGTPGPTSFPVAQYDHSLGIAVTGGYVYRGTRSAGLVGRYIFGDFGSGRIFSIDCAAQETLNMTEGFVSGLAISSFGQGVDGELFVVDYSGGLYQIVQ
jgi:glucose/arabinose dehydrogenase